jgi:hypothetical protein
MFRFGTSLMMMAAMLLSVGVHAGQAQYGEAVEGSAKADSLDACVAPTPFMRRSHFELIKHQRDITVHQGIRDTDDSLAGCVDVTWPRTYTVTSCRWTRRSSSAPVAMNIPV